MKKTEAFRVFQKRDPRFEDYSIGGLDNLFREAEIKQRPPSNEALLTDALDWVAVSERKIHKK